MSRSSKSLLHGLQGNPWSRKLKFYVKKIWPRQFFFKMDKPFSFGWTFRLEIKVVIPLCTQFITVRSERHFVYCFFCNRIAIFNSSKWMSPFVQSSDSHCWSYFKFSGQKHSLQYCLSNGYHIHEEYYKNVLYSESTTNAWKMVEMIFLKTVYITWCFNSVHELFETKTVLEKMNILSVCQTYCMNSMVNIIRFRRALRTRFVYGWQRSKRQILLHKSRFRDRNISLHQQEHFTSFIERSCLRRFPAHDHASIALIVNSLAESEQNTQISNL